MIRNSLYINPGLSTAKPGNHRQSWTIAHDEFVEKNNGIMTHAEIGKALGRSAAAVQRRVHALGLQQRTYSEWSKDEEKILNDIYPSRGLEGVIHALSAAGFSRTKSAITGKVQTLKLERLALFESISSLTQPEFFQFLSRLYFESTGDKLTYQVLAEMCHVSYSSMQKWFAPGSGQQPLSIQLKHHFWLACKFAIASRKRKISREHRQDDESDQVKA
ncbi:AsnC family protein [Pseudomonas sp. MRSN 12121]|uniref:AsnC family protein n=1 Tax=Pseudomonas sp. MRSN 12121 TaxID=1611770 RepID=UPI000A3EC6D5|nr:AsnC family protein [Pseudomonas sp. MRSN 12121]